MSAQPPEYRLAYPNVIDGASLPGEPRLTADAVVIGSGAGGAVAAARLRDAGLDVLLVEEGTLERTETFTTDPATMIQRLYRDAGTSMILGRHPIIFAEGRCVGGSTVINGGMAWRPPARVLDNWERGLGLDGTSARAMEPYFDAAEAILHTEPNHEDTFGGNTHLFLKGASALGWPVARAPRNMRRCVGLNNCALGCPTGAKQSMLVTEIPRALAAGASLLTHARVDHVTWRGSKARGVTGRLLDTDGRPRGRFHVDADLVVVAAGARHTPGILKRSRVWSRQVGRGLHTHPNAKCVGIFDQRFDPWAGTHQAFHIHHFLDDGILIGYAAVPPGLLAAAIPGLGAQNAEKMALYNHMLTAATLVDDETEGRVRLGPDLQPFMWQTLDGRDIERIHRGVALTAELLFAAGAREVLLPFSDLHAIRNPGEIRLIHERQRDRGVIELMTVHIMGTARMARDASHGATDDSGAVFDTTGLVIADASAIPTSLGVNPQETIVALTLRNVDRWLERRGRARPPLRRRGSTAPEVMHAGA